MCEENWPHSAHFKKTFLGWIIFKMRKSGSTAVVWLQRMGLSFFLDNKK